MSDAAPLILEKIDFGRLDAEQDENLLDYFVAGGQADAVMGGKYLVVGRKGSGKTALFRYVEAEAKHIIVPMDLKDYAFQAHPKLTDAGVPEAFAYTTSWRFSIGIAMFLELSRSLKWYSKTRRRGFKILKKIGAGPNGGPLRAIAQWIGRVRKIDLPSVLDVASLGGFELDDEDKRFLDDSSMQLLIDLEALLKEASKKHKITALIDRLDDAWDGSEESLRLIGGAARAARHFSEIIPKQSPAPVVVFLRSDLWDQMSFNDQNKFVQDTVELTWDEDELATVVTERFKTGRTEERDPELPGSWGDVFTADEMRQRFTSKRYVLKRALGRPRDALAFATFARDVAVEKGHGIIEKDDIYDAESKYSNHIVRELRDEIGEHLGNFSVVINTITALGKRNFTLVEWQESALKSGMTDTQATDALNKLFEASAVGLRRTGGGGGGSQTRFRYMDRFVKPAEAGALQFHPSLTRELSLTEK
ncbi:P-loop ATPase, Sll1717 family [Leucobacter komagatae]|uniref:Uncharacterized protein n=1 Tax=Leucobacter komagatae TaxID=55969 RepID=A0A0D0HZ49_9MICO|nr:hypothetical protein [Leucobacter komagatae]KIP52866.1 hypothetical protein SD72_06645 [Leucobacter komagatae]